MHLVYEPLGLYWIIATLHIAFLCSGLDRFRFRYHHPHRRKRPLANFPSYLDEEEEDGSTPPSSPPPGVLRRKFDDEEGDDSDVCLLLADLCSFTSPIVLTTGHV